MFLRVSTATNLSFQAPETVCHHVGIPASLVSISPLLLYVCGRALLALHSLLLSFQETSLHDHERKLNTRIAP